MQFIDLKKQQSFIREMIEENIKKVLDHGSYIMGPEIKELEAKLANQAGTKYCVACSSGTDALLMPLLAWGIGPGDAVFTSPFTFIASAEVISLVGATPVFVDIDEKTYNLDPEKLDNEIEKVKAEGKLIPKLIIPVDIFGLLADYERIEKVAQKHDLLVLEDAAQSFGASFNGKKAGSYGEAAATSFFPAKPLGCYGDGGAVFTDSCELNELLISVRVHGQGENKYKNDRIGINGRIDSIQAAILLAKLTLFHNEIDQRNIVAKKYSDALREMLVVPHIPDGNISAWAQYSVLAKDSDHRDKLMAGLQKEGIPTAVYYPIPLHLQKAFEGLGYKKGDMAISEEIGSRIFSLPMHPYLTDEEIDKIADAIKSI
jgi:UDP-2-acetamido-2-deoxy-ribo-hexuluronate aminotransferase